MTNLLMLIPVALVLGALGLAGFLWALHSGQFDDLDGAANRILFDDDESEPPPAQANAAARNAAPPSDEGGKR